MPNVTGVKMLTTYAKLEIGDVPSDERIIKSMPKVRTYSPMMKKTYLRNNFVIVIDFVPFYALLSTKLVIKIQSTNKNFMTNAYKRVTKIGLKACKFAKAFINLQKHGQNNNQKYGLPSVCYGC